MTYGPTFNEANSVVHLREIIQTFEMITRCPVQVMFCDDAFKQLIQRQVKTNIIVNYDETL